MGRKFSSEDLQNTQERMLQDYIDIAQQNLKVKQKLRLHNTSQSDIEKESSSATTSVDNLNLNDQLFSAHSSVSNLSRQIDPAALKHDLKETKSRIESLKAELNKSVQTYLKSGDAQPDDALTHFLPSSGSYPHTERSPFSLAASAPPTKLFNSEPLFARQLHCYDMDQLLHRHHSYNANVPDSVPAHDYQQDIIERLCSSLAITQQIPTNSDHQRSDNDPINARQSSYPETSFPAHNRHPIKNLSETSLLKMMYISEKEKLEKLKRHLTLIETESDSEVLGNDKERILLMQKKDTLLKEFKKIISHKSSQDEIDMVNRNIQSLERDLQGALESSNRTISDRIKLQNKKTKIMKELQTSMEEIAKIEEKLKKTSTLDINTATEETLTHKNKFINRASTSSSTTEIQSPPALEDPTCGGQWHLLYLDLLRKEGELQNLYRNILVSRGIVAPPRSDPQDRHPPLRQRHPEDPRDEVERHPGTTASRPNYGIPRIYVSQHEEDHQFGRDVIAVRSDPTSHITGSTPSPSPGEAPPSPMIAPDHDSDRYDTLYKIASYISVSNTRSLLNSRQPQGCYSFATDGYRDPGESSGIGMGGERSLDPCPLPVTTPSQVVKTPPPPYTSQPIDNYSHQPFYPAGLSQPHHPGPSFGNGMFDVPRTETAKSKTITECYAFV